MAATHTFRSQLAWSGTTAVGYRTYDRNHRVTTPPALAGLDLASDAAFLGDPSRQNPEQLLLAAASSCQLLSLLALAARDGVDVLAYDDDAEAVMPATRDRMRITRIVLRPRIVVAAGTDVARVRTLVADAHEACYIANTLGCEIEIDPTVEHASIDPTPTTAREEPVSAPTRTSEGIAYDRAGPRGGPTVVLLHAGVADRRMWEPQWGALTAARDVVRLDLRGFGDSDARPPGALCALDDVARALTSIGVTRCHLVGASFGAGIAVEVALTRPDLVASLLLVAPGGSLMAGRTPDLDRFVDAERAAFATGDVDAAIEENLRTWVDGPHRDATAVDPTVRESVRTMQLRAFELTVDWDDVEEDELDPPALERLDAIAVPTVVLVGGLDLDAVHDAADRVTAGIAGARRVDWPDVAHLPSLERPGDFLALLESSLG